MKRRFVADAIFFAVLVSFAVQIIMIGLPFSSNKKSSGVVYAAAGVPVYGAMVSASGSEGSGYAMANSLGQYRVTEGLKTGTYTVNVMAIGYLNSQLENVQVTVGHETPGIDFYLQRSGGVSGKVTDAVSGQPLRNITITAFTSDGGSFGFVGFTDVNGNYNIATNLATGTYNVSAFFPEGYASKSIGGIAITAGAEVKNVNLALERSGIISGRVIAASDSSPLANASVYASSGSDFGMAETNATGYYRISSGLATGKYIVTAIYLGMNVGYVMDVSVTAGAETSNVDISINVTPPPPSGIIMGKVTDMSSKPIPNALVTAQAPGTHEEAHTDENGDYVIYSGLATGTYTVIASAPGYQFQNRTGVSVVEEQVTSNINFQLPKLPPEQSGIISGTVQGEPNPIPEFQYPIAMLFITTLLALALARSFKSKTKIL